LFKKNLAKLTALNTLNWKQSDG